jgi:hypothetical protein
MGSEVRWKLGEVRSEMRWRMSKDGECVEEGSEVGREMR